MNDQEIMQLVAERLKALRLEHGFTNASQFAEEIGVDGPRLSRMESGKQGISTLVLRRAAEKLGVEMDAFFRRPARETVLLRDSGGDKASADAALAWAKALRSDLTVIDEYRHGLERR